MTNALIVALLTVLRIGVPAFILLSLGEWVRRQNQIRGNWRGA